MGKRIIQQARGKGSLTYRVRRKAYSHKIGYPQAEGDAEIISLIHSTAHSAPLMKIKIGNDTFFNPAFNHATVGETISLGGKKVISGNIIALKDIPIGTKIYNLERNPGDGGKMIRTAGSSATLSKKLDSKKVIIQMPNKKQVTLNENCRATIGIIAGSGRNLKPVMKAGARFYKMRALGRLYPRISAVSVNAIDHPFGSGRGKRIKPKISKRNASPGRKVGHLRPKRTGKRK